MAIMPVMYLLSYAMEGDMNLPSKVTCCCILALMYYVPTLYSYDGMTKRMTWAMVATYLPQPSRPAWVPFTVCDVAGYVVPLINYVPFLCGE